MARLVLLLEESTLGSHTRPGQSSDAQDFFLTGVQVSASQGLTGLAGIEGAALRD